MPSTRQPYRRTLPFYAAIAVGLMVACGHESPPSVSAPSAVDPIDIPAASGAPSPPTQTDPPAKASHDVTVASVGFSDYGCMHIQAGPVNFSDEGFLPDDAVVRIRFVATSADPANDYVHAAVFKVIEGEPQQLNNSNSKEFRVGALDIFTIEVPIKNVQECVTYQVDAGCGRRPPPDAKYAGNGREQDFIESWRIGNRCAPLPRPTPTPDPTPTPGPSPTMTPTPAPTPTPTPTPGCNQPSLRFSSSVPGTCTTPTPTPTPRSTPTPTATPSLTPPTPTPRGTPTPTPTATPTPQSTPTPTPTSTPTPRATPTPTPPPTPTPCRTNYTFRHDPSVRIGGTGYLTGTASFSGPGFWEFRIAATSTQSKCNNRVYDYPQKQYQSRRYQCGDSTNGNIDLQYAWGTHASNWWRVTLELDGNIVADSGCLDNPYN